MADQKPSFASTFPPRVEVFEVGPRDGLQNELRTLQTTDKARLIEALIDAGERRIEVSSFVSPRWIPQLADAEKLLSLLKRPEGVTFTALVPNLKGLERAKHVGAELPTFVGQVDHPELRQHGAIASTPAPRLPASCASLLRNQRGPRRAALPSAGLLGARLVV